MGEYKQRRPKEKALWKVVKAKLEELKEVWEERFEKRYGRWRGVAEKELRDYIRCSETRVCKNHV